MKPYYKVLPKTVMLLKMGFVLFIHKHTVVSYFSLNVWLRLGSGLVSEEHYV